MVRTTLLLLALPAGCMWPPSAECDAYVACQRAYDETVDTTAFEAGGECWINLSTSVRCTSMCRDALEALRELRDPPEECG